VVSERPRRAEAISELSSLEEEPVMYKPDPLCVEHPPDKSLPPLDALNLIKEVETLHALEGGELPIKRVENRLKVPCGERKKSVILKVEVEKTLLGDPSLRSSFICW
jgi:hypothetical protein